MNKQNKQHLVPWSGALKSEQIDLTIDYGLGGWLKKNAGSIGSVVGGIGGAIIGGPAGAALGSKLGGSVGSLAGNLGKEEDPNTEAIAQAQLAQKQDSLNSMPTASKGVVPGVANPYDLALGGLSTTSENPQEHLTDYEAGSTHENNPLGGVPIGFTDKGTQNSVEQGESSFNFDDGKYIFSNRLIV